MREEKNNICLVGLWGTLRSVLSTCRRISTNSLHQLYAFSMKPFKQDAVGEDFAEANGVAGLLFDFCHFVVWFLNFDQIWALAFRVEGESCRYLQTTFSTCGMWWRLSSKLVRIVWITVYSASAATAKSGKSGMHGPCKS